MLSVKEAQAIHVYTAAVDMRKAIDGLSLLVAAQLERNPQSGDVFIFRNKAGDKVKALVWDKNGFILHYKRLERGRFKFPNKHDEGSYPITTEQFSWLFAGLDFILMHEFSELNYENYY